MIKMRYRSILAALAVTGGLSAGLVACSGGGGSSEQTDTPPVHTDALSLSPADRQACQVVKDDPTFSESTRAQLAALEPQVTNNVQGPVRQALDDYAQTTSAGVQAFHAKFTYAYPDNPALVNQRVNEEVAKANADIRYEIGVLIEYCDTYG